MPLISNAPSTTSSSIRTFDNVLSIDFESYYNSKIGYTLKKISMLEYIKDPRFEAFGAAVRGYGFSQDKSTWISGPELAHVFRGIDWSKVTLCAQNTKFDGAILAWKYSVVPRAYIDTKSMAAAHLGTKIRDNSLAIIAAHYGLKPKGFLMTDGLVSLTKEQEAQLADYSCHDNNLCWDILHTMLREGFPQSQFSAIDWTIRRFILPMLRLDGPKLKELNESEKARKASLFADIMNKYPFLNAHLNKTGENPRNIFTSNDRFSKVLTERKFEIPMKPSPTAKKRGENKMIAALAVGDADFQDMLASENEELADLCEARVQAKSNLLETRSAKYLKLVDLGPWPFDMNFSGAKQTHRYSGASGGGGNPQNLTRKSALRGAVCAPEGWKMGVADFAGIELRVSAWLACELKLMSAISEGRDIYCEFASKIFGRTITKADIWERQFGKICILALGYGMGWEKFIYTVRVQADKIIDEDEARRVVELYRHTYDRIESYWRTLNFMIPRLYNKESGTVPNAPFLKLRNGEIILPSGLALRYPNLRQVPDENGRPEWVYDVWRNGHKETTKLYGGKLLENICQALAGEITKVAIERAESKGLFCAGQVHDEILALISALRAEEGRSILRNAMETPMPWWPVLKLNAEIGIGDNWLEAKA